MPAQKPPKPVAKSVLPLKAKSVPLPAPRPVAKAIAKATSTQVSKAPVVPQSKALAPSSAKTGKTTLAEVKKAVAVTAAAASALKKKPGRPPNTAPATTAAAPVRIGAKRGPKPKGSIAEPNMDDLQDVVAEFAEEPAMVDGEKVKPLRMKISKAKERALMKEFGLDETILSEEDLAKRRQRLKALIKLGKTRGYLTHGEISDHLPDKLVDAETLEVVISMLNDMGVAVYEQTPDAETLLLNNTTDRKSVV